MAAGGFTSVTSEYLAADADDLGGRWRLEELYVKAYPCCRWSQGAIRAATAAGGGRAFAAHEVERVGIRTFAAADGLAKIAPMSTEEAQYSLVWPVATVLARGDFTVADVLGPWDDPDVAALAGRIDVHVDADLTASFPARRLTAVDGLLRSGERLSAGPLEALGEPDDPGWPDVVVGKVATLIDAAHDLADPPPIGLRAFGPAELLGLWCASVASGAHA
jgi:2-methylcitrate dehydratase PrpD